MQNLLSFEQAIHQFPIDQDICYLNHAAVSPWPVCAKEALMRFAEENVKQGATSYPEWLNTEKELRQKLKQLINAESTDEIALAKNTSEALSIIAYGLNWNAGDEVLISNHEFPSNRIVWESLEQFGVRVITADFNTDSPEQEVIKLINPNTKLVSLSSVQFASGISIDLSIISKTCKQHNSLLCVDAIQSLGAIPFDQQHIDADFIVADGHKWMMAAEGLALLFVRASVQDSLKLNQYGWHMVKHRGNYDLPTWSSAEDATRFECGSPNMLGIHTLNASLELLLDIGIEPIHKAIVERVIYLEDKLSENPMINFLSPRTNSNNQSTRSGIVTFNIENQNSATLHQSLMNKKIICANRGGGIRFSPHFYTQQETLDRAVAIINEHSK